MATDIRRNEDEGRYELVIDEQLVGVADFRVESDDVLVFPHTEIHPSRRGMGLGEQLVQAALDDVRRRGQRVRPRCWFVHEFIEQHPEYGELVA